MVVLIQEFKKVAEDTFPEPYFELTGDCITLFPICLYWNVIRLLRFLYPVKRFPRGELQRTTHHSDSCTLCQRYSLEPSTLKANEPDKTFKQHEKGKLEIGKHKMNEVWLMRLECEASVHCLS